jgi:hypothetical protein
MAKYKPRRQSHYLALREEHFTVKEAREFSRLPRSTPALRALREDRKARWDKFAKMADGKIERGRWRRKDVPKKWKESLLKLYRKNRWLVKEGAKGKQQKLGGKNAPNPWAEYRKYEKVWPGKNYTSPWELKAIKSGKTKFDRGQFFIQRAERGEQKSTIEHWIRQLGESAKLFPSQADKFSAQAARLRAML